MIAPHYCACGRPLHYTNAFTQRVVQMLIDAFGPDVKVTDAHGRAWMVPRHYLALHGMRGKDLHEIAQALGFQQVAP